MRNGALFWLTVGVAAGVLASKGWADSVTIPPPPPAMTSPPATAGLLGSSGTSNEYARADHTHASSVQKMNLTTDASGNVTWTFGRPFPSTSYSVNVLAGAPKVSCSWTNKTATSVTFNCRQAQTLPQLLTGLNIVTSLIGFDIFANPAAGIQIDAFAGAVTQ